MRKIISTVFLCFIFVFTFSSHVNADKIYLKNKQMLQGEIVHEAEDGILLDVGFGKVGIKMHEIEKIERDQMPGIKKGKGEPELSVGAINSSYYSLLDKGAGGIRFKLEPSNKKILGIELRQEQGKTALANEVLKMEFFVKYDLSKDEPEFSVSNKPSPEDDEDKKRIEEFVKTIENAVKIFWRTWRPYVTRLIDEDKFEIKSIKFMKRDEEIKLVMADKEEKEHRYIFDRNHRLKYWDIFALADYYNERPSFEIYNSKYLVRSVKITHPAKTCASSKEDKKKDKSFKRIDILYQEIRGIKVPKKAYLHSKLGSAADVTMIFEDVKINR